MGSIRTVENLGKLVKLTVSTLQLPASRLNIGSFQYNTSALTLNTAVTGVGGCDVAVAANSVYYTYAVVSSGVVYLIGSLSSSLPSGFTQARKVGAFTTGTTSQILEAFYYGQVLSPGEWESFTPTGTWSTNTTYTGKRRRVGPQMEIQYRLVFAGAPDAVSLYLNLPTGFTIDTSVTLDSSSAATNLGTGNIRTTAGNLYQIGVRYGSSTSLSLLSARPVSVASAAAAFISNEDAINRTSPHTIASGEFLFVKASVPIAEWAGSGTQFVW